ncbi:MAG: hypothetical protein KDA41_00290, partial [Planctomycetales bacterium]|nr:hypothetical protein [Planctomycetales bacterium]
MSRRVLRYAGLLAVAAFAVLPHAPAPGEGIQGPRGPDALDQLLRSLVLEAIPHQYEDLDDWGKTQAFTTGVKVKLSGLKFDADRRRKELNHGQWDRFRVELADLDTFAIDLHDVRPTAQGAAGFAIDVTAPLQVHARRAHWRRGVQLYSVAVDADAVITMTLHCESTVALTSKGFSPAVRLQPSVTAAELSLRDFKLTGVGKVHGPVAHELGDLVRDRIAARLAAQNEKLVQKINAKLASQQDKLCFSLASLGGSA